MDQGDPRPVGGPGHLHQDLTSVPILKDQHRRTGCLRLVERHGDGVEVLVVVLTSDGKRQALAVRRKSEGFGLFSSRSAQFGRKRLSAPKGDHQELIIVRPVSEDPIARGGPSLLKRPQIDAPGELEGRPSRGRSDPEQGFEFIGGTGESQTLPIRGPGVELPDAFGRSDTENPLIGNSEEAEILPILISDPFSVRGRGLQLARISGLWSDRPSTCRPGAKRRSFRTQVPP